MTLSITRICMLTLLLIAVSGMPNAARADAVVGVNAAVSGDVYVIGVRKKIERRAKVRQSVLLGDRIRTRRQSALQVLLKDETIFTVGQNCLITIDEFVYDPKTTAGTLAASVAQGAFRFMTGKIGKANPSSVKIRTPAATLGVRGTIAEGAVGPNAASIARMAGVLPPKFDPQKGVVFVLRGPGRNSNSLDKVGSITVTSGGVTVVIDQPGYAVYVPYPGAPPIGPFLVTPEMLALLDLRLRSTPLGPGVNPLDNGQRGTALAGQGIFNTPGPNLDINLDERQETVFDGILPPPLPKFEYEDYIEGGRFVGTKQLQIQPNQLQVQPQQLQSLPK